MPRADAMTSADLARQATLERAAWWSWAPILVGLGALYVPTYLDLARTSWRTEEQSHGPLILAVSLFLMWRSRRALTMPAQHPQGAPGGILLAVGLLSYTLGRSQDIPILEVGSQIPVMLGVLLIASGWRALRDAWFPVLFLLFLVPLPGILVDSLTLPLKQSVSVAAEQLLYAAGYPVARNGVVLTVGQYELLVADACSGLHSLFSLSALGLLYLYLVRHTSWIRNAVLALSILPIGFAANLLRVLVLVLITYHLGDAAGQGFLHGFAGIVLFVAALVMLVVVDQGLGRVKRLRSDVVG